MNKVLRWGILGTGNIAKQFAVGVAGAPRTQIVAVGSRSIASASGFAQGHSIAAAYGAYDQLLADDRVDAVYISLPNSMHHEWTLRSLRAGKHVLCEKPFATNLRQAQEMFDAAERAGKVLIEAFMYLTHPLTRAVVQAVRSGIIGNVKLIRSSFCYRTTRIAGNIRFDPALSSGALMDVGCYCTTFSNLIADEAPAAMDVVGHRHDTGVDDLAAGTLTYPNGIIASFACGMTLQADNTASICGDEGFVEIPIPWKPPKQNARFIIGRGTPPRMDAGGKLVAPRPPREERTVDAPFDLYGNEAESFADTVLDSKPPFMTRQQTLENQRILDELRRQIGVPM